MGLLLILPISAEL
jgi:hypothetical protein